jgi:hypothetical protein
VKVNVLRSGGFAGLTTGWQVRVDEQPDPDGWVSLVEACPWDEPGRGTPGADRYVYEFQAGPHKATLGEALVEGPWRVLADRVRADGRRLPAAELSPLGY